MTRILPILGVVGWFILPNHLVPALKIASDVGTIEHTPGRIAIEDYYEGDAQIVGGGITALVSDSSVDLGTNAEIPSLRTYATHKNLRIIYTMTETYYRIVANASVVPSLEDLKGKRIGTLPGSTAAYFVEKYLATVGLESTDYTLASGSPCSAAPCGRGTLPYQLATGAIDAVAIWEPTPELAVQALGPDAIVFQDRSVYRELVNLHSTVEKLADPDSRSEIVDFVRALNKAEEVFRTNPETVWDRVASALGVNTSVIEAVFPIHAWRGTLAPDLLDVLVTEDPWVAKANNRAALSVEDLADLIDSSVLDEVLRMED